VTADFLPASYHELSVIQRAEKPVSTRLELEVAPTFEPAILEILAIRLLLFSKI
jgi:hypothetical protein